MCIIVLVNKAFVGEATAAEEDSEDCEIENTQHKTMTKRSRSPPPLTVNPALATGHHHNRHQLFQPSRISPFHSFTSHFLPSESVYESAAKLLFMSIKWARSVPSFLQLQEGDQTMLLEDSWAQLFIIGLAQWAIQFDEGMHKF